MKESFFDSPRMELLWLERRDVITESWELPIVPADPDGDDWELPLVPGK